MWKIVPPESFWLKRFKRKLLTKRIRKPGYNLGNCIVESEDGNYLVAGTHNFDATDQSRSEDRKNALVETWDLGSEDSFEGLTLSHDGGIVLTGYRNGLGEGTFLNWGRGLVLNKCKRGRRMVEGFIKFTSSGYRIKNPEVGLFFVLSNG